MPHPRPGGKGACAQAERGQRIGCPHELYGLPPSDAPELERGLGQRRRGGGQPHSGPVYPGLPEGEVHRQSPHGVRTAPVWDAPDYLLLRDPAPARCALPDRLGEVRPEKRRDGAARGALWPAAGDRAGSPAGDRRRGGGELPAAEVRLPFLRRGLLPAGRQRPGAGPGGDRRLLCPGGPSAGPSQPEVRGGKPSAQLGGRGPVRLLSPADQRLLYRPSGGPLCPRGGGAGGAYAPETGPAGPGRGGPGRPGSGGDTPSDLPPLLPPLDQHRLPHRPGRGHRRPSAGSAGGELPGPDGLEPPLSEGGDGHPRTGVPPLRRGRQGDHRPLPPAPHRLSAGRGDRSPALPALGRPCRPAGRGYAAVPAAPGPVRRGAL